MLKKVIISLLSVIFFYVLSARAVAADDPAFICSQMDEKVSGDLIKYALHGDANGPVYFNGISCAIEHRNRELCAMEMVSFDSTAKVYDYYTAEEIDISKAYFWLHEKNTETPIAAFASKGSAEKYGAAREGGVILDYSGLTDRGLGL